MIAFLLPERPELASTRKETVIPPMQPARKILMGLALHFVFWWVVSAWLWIRGFGWILWALASPLSPILLGISYLWTNVWQIGVCAIAAVTALILLTVMAWRKKRVWIILLAHLAVIVYWFFSFVLIAAET